MFWPSSHLARPAEM
jgi:hypothetical protein